jgi:hypothetical protein
LHDVERQEVEAQRAERADKFLVAGDGTDADIDLVGAFDGSRRQAGIQNLGAGAIERLRDTREGFGGEKSSCDGVTAE